MNIAEFKRSMGSFMRRVRAGGTVVLCDRSEPVARLTRFEDAGQARLRALPPRKPPESFTPPRRVKASGPATSLDALRADREER